jgi:hypothetical protein
MGTLHSAATARKWTVSGYTLAILWLYVALAATKALCATTSTALEMIFRCHVLDWLKSISGDLALHLYRALAQRCPFSMHHNES